MRLLRGALSIRWVAAAITRRAASQMDVAPTAVAQVSQGLLYTNYFVKVSLTNVFVFTISKTGVAPTAA